MREVLRIFNLFGDEVETVEGYEGHSVLGTCHETLGDKIEVFHDLSLFPMILTVPESGRVEVQEMQNG